MPRSRWTLVLVPHDNERVRSFQISAKSVRSAISAMLAVVVVLGTLSVGFFVKKGQEVRADSLRRENELLASEVDQMRGQMAQLNRSLTSLSQRGDSYRALAG